MFRVTSVTCREALLLSLEIVAGADEVCLGEGTEGKFFAGGEEVDVVDRVFPEFVEIAELDELAGVTEIVALAEFADIVGFAGVFSLVSGTMLLIV